MIALDDITVAYDDVKAIADLDLRVDGVSSSR
jgi:hypothetical protein